MEKLKQQLKDLETALHSPQPEILRFYMNKKYRELKSKLDSYVS